MKYLANGCTIDAEGFSDINGSIVVGVHFKDLLRQCFLLGGFVSDFHTGFFKRTADGGSMAAKLLGKSIYTCAFAVKPDAKFEFFIRERLLILLVGFYDRIGSIRHVGQVRVNGL